MKPRKRRSAQKTNREVGARIRAARTRAGLSQGAVAEAMGLSVGQVSRYEAGRNGADGATLVSFARALNCDASEFFDGVPA